MDNYNSKDNEYVNFMAKLINKADEIHRDYEKLSPDCRLQVNNTVMNYIMTSGITAIYNRNL